MNITKVVDNTYKLTVNLEDMLFEGLWEIPNGVSLNSYIIKGEKTAIIDGVCGWDGVPESLFKLLDELEIELSSIEYLIINHMEPDHSGWIEDLRKIHPDFKVVCSQESADLLEAFYDHTENIMVVGDDDTLDLGNGHVLEFVKIPNVHWPDTIATFDRSTKTLFSCDAFGSFGRTGEKSYDDMLSQEEIDFYEKEAVRYYANIVAAFSMPVKKAIEKAGGLPIEIIAPGHGIVWRKDPGKIINDYIRYADYQRGPAKEKVTIIWGSMYGMTEKGARQVAKILEREGMDYDMHQVPETSWGTLLASVWESTGVVLAMPTYEYKMFPPMAAALEEMAKKRAFGKKAFRLGSYGWSGGAQRELDNLIDRCKLNWDFIEPVEFKGNARDEELDRIEEQTMKLIEEVRNAVNA